MSGRWLRAHIGPISGMLVKGRFLLVVLLLSGSCRGGPQFVRMCEAENRSEQFTIDYVGNMVVGSDYSFPIQHCEGRAARCITRPFPFAAPPAALLRQGTFRWASGGHDFSASRLDDGRYAIIASNSRGERHRYLYERDEGRQSQGWRWWI